MPSTQPIGREGHNDGVPRVVRPNPPPPVNVAVATRVFGSEPLVALIRHYWRAPGAQRDAAETLGLPQQLVSRNTRLLVDAGVLTEETSETDRRTCTYRVDPDRVRTLLAALSDYSLG